MRIPGEIVVLFSLGNKEMDITKISKISDMTYSQTHKLIKRLEEKNLLTTKKQGRKRFVKATERGKTLRELYRDFLVEWNV